MVLGGGCVVMMVVGGGCVPDGIGWWVRVVVMMVLGGGCVVDDDGIGWWDGDWVMSHISNDYQSPSRKRKYISHRYE